MSVEVDGKSLVELLDMLVPAPVPEPIPMTPQTWGWLALAVVVVAVIVVGLPLFRGHQRSNAYRRAALADLQAANDDPAKVAEILRRTALVAYPRAKVASLHGQEWLNFLQQTAEKMPVSSPASRLLLEGSYRISPSSPELSHMARVWIQSHKPEGGRR
ncbi:DUF4381 domain-containing protein [Ruegeria atlantica]|uniref:DUF4381 domain-containing protein n=1 Tax=Ruegeria atlantica TaxID=81569 RepID=UPI001479EE65|nr:DUF4381 domain-containing protein [Ruegeria atlantica]